MIPALLCPLHRVPMPELVRGVRTCMVPGCDRQFLQSNHDGAWRMCRLADREARRKLKRVFRELWKRVDGPMDRQEAYAWLAGAMGMTVKACRIQHFSAEECARAAALCWAFTAKQVYGQEIKK